jgi:hypothetical protein
VAAELDSEWEAASAADSPEELVLVLQARPVGDSAADSAVRGEVLAVYPAADSQEESVLVLLADPVGDSAMDSQDRAADSQADAAEQAGVPAGLRAAAVVAQELWVPAASPSAESSGDLVEGLAVDWSGDTMTMRLKSRQRQSAVFEDSASYPYSFSLRITPAQSTCQGKSYLTFFLFSPSNRIAVFVLTDRTRR